MYIKIAIADDHPMVLTGLQNMLSEYPNIQLTGTYLDGTSLLAGLEEDVPNVLLLDIQMPGQTGEELSPLIRMKYPDIKILVLTNFDSPTYLSSMLRHGASGYLLKSTNKDLLINAIETVYAGREFIEPAMQKKMELLEQQSGRLTVTRIKLTSREKEVLQLIVEGLTDKEIAEKLFLSLHTTKNYRKSLLLKLNVKNTATLIRTALQLGLVF